MKWIPAVIVVAAVLVSAVLYPRLSDPVPIHWNAQGNVNGYASRPVGAFLMPVVMLFVALLFKVLPGISPKGYAIDGASRGYRAIVAATLLLLLAIHVVALVAATGREVAMNTIMPVALGALFAVIGNYLTTMPRNFFVGIRTPWTLANEDVWFRTHRLGGRLFMVGGLVIALLPLFGVRAIEPGLIGVLVTVSVVSIAYSYIVYRQIEQP